MSDHGLSLCTEKMRAAGVNQVAIDVFSHYYRLCERGETGIIPESSIAPLLDPPQLAEVEVTDEDALAALGATVMILSLIHI